MSRPTKWHGPSHMVQGSNGWVGMFPFIPAVLKRDLSQGVLQSLFRTVCIRGTSQGVGGLRELPLLKGSALRRGADGRSQVERRRGGGSL